LMTSSYFVGCSTGMSPGFVPRRILSTYLPTFRACRRRSPIGAVLRQLFQEHLFPARGQAHVPTQAIFRVFSPTALMPIYGTSRSYQLNESARTAVPCRWS
jgi:hypothetical protein